MLRVCALAMLTGCFSWAQADPPPRETWNVPHQHCDPQNGPAIVAFAVAVLAGGGAAAILATTDDGLGDIEERSWGTLLIPVSIGYGIDAINAAGDARSCREYQAQPQR